MAVGSLGSLVVSMAVDTARFQGDLGRAAAIAEQRMRRIRDTASRALGALTIAATAAGAALVASLGAGLRRADEFGKLAQRIGTTTEHISALTYAARLADVSQEELAVGLTKLGSSAADAANGLKAPEKAFKALGISVKGQDGQLKSLEQLVNEVADSFAAAPDGIQKTALAVDIFGRSGAKLIPLLNQGSEGLRKMRLEAEAFGQVVDSRSARAAETFNDNLTRLRGTFSGLGNLITAELAPSLAAFSDELLNSAKNSGALKSAAEVLANIVRGIASAGVFASSAFKSIGTTFGALAASFAAFVRGDFSTATEIMKERLRDAAKEVEVRTKLIDSIWKDAGAQAAADAPRTGGQLAAPALTAAALVRKATDEIRAAVSQSISGFRTVEDLLAQPLGPSTQEQAAETARHLAEINAELFPARDKTFEVAENFVKAKKGAESLAETLRDESIRRGLGFISDAIANASGGIRQFARDILDAFRRILADSITRQFVELLQGLGTRQTGTGGSGLLKTIGGFFTNLFGGTRDSGGRGMAGKVYAIGKGAQPELFMPGSAGQFIPRQQLGGINYAPVTNVYNDSRSDGAEITRNMLAISDAVSRKHLEQFRQMVGRGGRIASG